MKLRLSLAIMAAVICCNQTLAKVKLPEIISDNMVLQQQTEVAVWGTARPGAGVSVKGSWSSRSYSTRADKDGKWLVRVATPKAGGPYSMTISDGEPLKISNILVGEVWYCSGQSNMEMPIHGWGSQPVEGAPEAMLRANKTTPIRICEVYKQSSVTVKDSCHVQWFEHTPEAVGDCSAVAYYFAQYLQSIIGIPVAVIVDSWGGSKIETWIKREVFESQFKDVDLGHLDGSRELKNKHMEPCLLWNGQVAPIVPYTFKGILWYQGEANRGNPDRYIEYQKAYVQMMRDEFCVPEAPFYCVQIAPYPYDDGTKTHSGYFCEAQQKSCAQIEHSGYATTVDLGEYGTIHPRRKYEVGRRLALLALRNDYGYDYINASAPVYKSVEFTGRSAIIDFECGTNKLNPMNAEITGFEVAGRDRIFHPAKARVYYKDGNKVEVWSDEVGLPKAVRYCFRNWCEGNLYNSWGIPAGPFRTDDWPQTVK